jgi:hypothetical protein
MLGAVLAWLPGVGKFLRFTPQPSSRKKTTNKHPVILS